MTKTNRQINKEDEMRDNSPDSPAVIAYRLGQVESAVKDGFIEHNNKLDSIIGSFATKADAAELDRRVTSLEANQTWVVRAVIGQVILALFAVIAGAVVLRK